MVKNLPVMQKTQVRSLGQEDPLQKGMATHSSILALEIPWTEKPGRLLSMGSQRVRDDSSANTLAMIQTTNKSKYNFFYQSVTASFFLFVVNFVIH